MEVRSTQQQEILSSNEYIEYQKIEHQKTSFLNALEKDTQPVFTCEICSKLTIKTPEQRQRRNSSVFFVNFKHISQLALRFLLLPLNM